MQSIVSASTKSFPFALQDGMVVRGLVGKIEPWAAGLILVDVGGQHVILPDVLDRWLRKQIGHRAEVLRLGGYTFRRLDP